MKQTFYIVGGGDFSVGIPSSNEVVTFEGNIEFTEDMIVEVKKFLKELDDNYGAIVLTEHEYNEMMEEEAEALKK